MKQASTYQSTMNGNVLITTITGTITVADTRRIFNQLKEQVNALDGVPWANLIDARLWELSAIGIEQILLEMETWVRLHGRSHLVFVIGTEHSEIKKFALKKLMGNNLKKAEVMVAQSMDDALIWLGRCGYPLENVAYHAGS